MGRKRRPRSCGVTLMEILVVLSIIMILASLTIASISILKTKAKRNAAESLLNGLSLAIEQFEADNTPGHIKDTDGPYVAFDPYHGVKNLRVALSGAYKCPNCGFVYDPYAFIYTGVAGGGSNDTLSVSAANTWTSGEFVGKYVVVTRAPRADLVLSPQGDMQEIESNDDNEINIKDQWTSSIPVSGWSTSVPQAGDHFIITYESAELVLPFQNLPNTWVCPGKVGNNWVPCGTAKTRFVRGKNYIEWITPDKIGHGIVELDLNHDGDTDDSGEKNINVWGAILDPWGQPLIYYSQFDKSESPDAWRAKEEFLRLVKDNELLLSVAGQYVLDSYGPD